jgi:hypothetical protein
MIVHYSNSNEFYLTSRELIYSLHVVVLIKITIGGVDYVSLQNY